MAKGILSAVSYQGATSEAAENLAVKALYQGTTFSRANLLPFDIGLQPLHAA